MTVYLVNPSHLSFGVGVITPRWLFVLAGATPASYGQPRIVDETLEPFDIDGVQAGDVVGIGIHTGNALRGYEIGNAARARGATVVFGGIHATLYPGEAQQLGGAHAVVRGDGDLVWPLVLDHAAHGTLQETYEGGRVDADRFVPARFSQALYDAARAPKRLLLVEGGSHNNSMRVASDEYREALAALFRLPAHR